MSSLMFTSLYDLLRSRGIQRDDDPFIAYDGYDFGIGWRGPSPSPFVYRLTWLGPLGRADGSAAPGELCLLSSHLANNGTAELLCVIPPVDDDPAANVRSILNGWADVCGEPNSIDWVRDRVAEALRAGWATAAVVKRGTHV